MCTVHIAFREMAPNLAAAQHDLIRDMNIDGASTYAEIGRAAECSRDAVKAISANLRRYGSTTAPHNGGRRRRSVTPTMTRALCEHLLRKPDLYLTEMVVFLWDEFETLLYLHTYNQQDFPICRLV